jgi:uncharacterized protein
VVVVWDTLKRDPPPPMRDAVAKLSRRAWRIDWLTPLATSRAFTPQTAGLVAIKPFVDEMIDGRTIGAVVSHILSLGSRRAA